jgi:aspartate dehydrogenase
MTTRLGLIGCGAISSEIARAAGSDLPDVEVSSLFDRNENRVNAIRDAISGEATEAAGIDDLIVRSDLVVEAASQEAVKAYATDVLETGTDLLMMSVGALADDDLRHSIQSAVRRSAGSLYMPSGAIAGLDAVKAAANAGLDAVSIETRKPPEGLAGAPYIDANGIELGAIDSERVIFEGPAREAATAFPSNVNVAMALSLAGIGPDETTVRIVADPDEDRNVHRITATGASGEIDTTVRNAPSPSNPKTSYLASLSAIERIRGVTEPMTVGT